MTGMSDDPIATVVALLEEKFRGLDKKLDKITDDHEVRLRRLEAWSYGIPVAALIALGSMVAAAITAFR